MSQDAPYNPLAKKNLGESVAEALLRRDVFALADAKRLVGAGIYALYYVGDFPIYAPLAADNAGGRFMQPIYVGKAVPKGARKGGLGLEADKGTALRRRLRIHMKSIDQANNLSLADFHFRALTLDDIWIPLGENVVIEKYQPLWNRVIDGFGNNTPGARRATQHRSQWDVLHPGRSSAEKLAANPLPITDIESRVEKFFSGRLSEAEKIFESEGGGEA